MKKKKSCAEDIIFRRRTEKAWKRYENGEFIEMEAEEFLEEIKKW